MNSNQRETVAAIRQLDNKDPKQREEAQHSLRSAQPKPTWALIQATYPIGLEAQQGALKALVYLAEPAAADTFMEHLENDDGTCRWLAAEGLIALGETGLNRVLNVLHEYPESDWLLRGTHHVLKGLMASGFEDVLAPVLAAYQSKAPAIELPAAAAAARSQRMKKQAAPPKS